MGAFPAKPARPAQVHPRQLVIDYVPPEPINRYNGAPSTKSPVIRADDEGIRLDAVKWGSAPF